MDDGERDVDISSLNNNDNNVEKLPGPALVYVNLPDESSMKVFDHSADDTEVDVPATKYRSEDYIYARVTARYDQIKNLLYHYMISMLIMSWSFVVAWKKEKVWMDRKLCSP